MNLLVPSEAPEMALDNYLQSMRGGTESEQGTFTLSEDRARQLLAEKALVDVWQSWLCLCQGMHRLGARRIEIDISRIKVVFNADFGREVDLETLLADERMLLGWLTIGWFGKPRWVTGASRLEIELKGSTWRRYRWASSLGKLLQTFLVYSMIEVKVNGVLVRRERLPVGVNLCLFPARAGVTNGLLFLDHGLEAKGIYERRVFPLWEEESDPTEPSARILAALASKEKVSWSEISWVHNGVVISRERNTLERPGVAVVASVEALGLETDLSGFKVIHDEQTMMFLRQVKRDVLCML